MVDLTADQTQWLLAFFAVVSGLLMYYALNLSNGMNTFKKEKKDARNAIKNSMEIQNVLPIITNVCMLLLSKVDISKKLEDEIEPIIYSKDTWAKLNSEIIKLEEKINELSEVDKVFDCYINYSSYFSKILFPLTLIFVAIIPIYIFGDLIAWTVWIIALVQVSVCLCIIKYKASKACSKLDAYEDSYVRG